jgi:hypothetical protein
MTVGENPYGIIFYCFISRDAEAPCSDITKIREERSQQERKIHDYKVMKLRAIQSKRC